jgi:hypothetical protein
LAGARSRAEGCPLCEAARLTHRYHEDELCWVADCEVCDVPMVVWRWHGASPPPAEVEHMLARLEEAATSRFGPGGFRLDPVMRQIPDHYHAHARDPSWWARLASGPLGRRPPTP